MPLAVGNPVHHWAHLELQRVFGIDTVLNADTAGEVWDNANAQLLSNPELGVRGLLKRFNVSLVCTTDDPAGDLSVHQQLAGEDTTQTLPTYRPDVAMPLISLRSSALGSKSSVNAAAQKSMTTQHYFKPSSNVTMTSTQLAVASLTTESRFAQSAMPARRNWTEYSRMPRSVTIPSNLQTGMFLQLTSCAM